ncbi:MAG: hypothetical protein NVS9B4_18450 [Candidatus Acidiferrum sp.]
MRLLNKWSQALQDSPPGLAALGGFLHPDLQATSLRPASEKTVRPNNGIEILRRTFAQNTLAGSAPFQQEIQKYFAQIPKVETAELQVVGIREIANSPLTLSAEIRYDLIGVGNGGVREQRTGYWKTQWSRDSTNGWRISRWEAAEETVSRAHSPVFIDISAQALGGTESYKNQLLRGTDHWRTVLDGACGIDVYGNNGLAAGDFDNDGFDDLYVCQPAGLPNRLYRNRGDGSFEDVTEKAGVGVLDSTSCALFADFENKGLQDLLVVCGTGPLLFLNQGNGKFSIKRDAFKFAKLPEGTFTHAALADYDRDGRLDIYFCLYSYYLGLDQYHYPVPYFDARNGPPNFLLHNEGNATFVDRTEAAGLNAENDRYSFACAWNDYDSNGWPDLYVANDFGRSNLYRNNGDGTFTATSGEAHVDDPGAGMSACWADFDNHGKQDIYVANMWSAAGQRVSQQRQFHENAPENLRALYRKHARGNSLYQNQGNGKFQNITQGAGVELGRWAWCSDAWDFDHDGYPDIYIANGYISGPDRTDLSSFFWRQVVAKSPEDATPSSAYEQGWNALNELIRSDLSWAGYERNVLYANNRDGTFSEVSGVAGLDFPEDSRSFVLADLDHDGRLEILLKNRNAPQLRVLRNAMSNLGASVAFRLRGKDSNRDAIGAAITVEAQTSRQIKYLQAGSGFLAQHSKELFFGLEDAQKTVRATVRWPNGSSQAFDHLPVNHRVEITEGSNEFSSKPFAKTPASYSQPGAPPQLEQLPSLVDTWLIEPLRAPDFSLPDLTGKTRELQSFRGGHTFLNLWAITAPQCRDALRLLQQHWPALAANKINIVAVNLDPPGDAAAVRSFSSQEKFSFPILLGTEEIAGIYNILYRFLFDRRRDLALPTSFLLDKDGLIIKVYQEPVHPQRVLDDVKSAPANSSDRTKKALPFSGTLYLSEFHRNDFTYGVSLFQHGYLEQAAASFRQVLAAKPQDPEANYNLGTLYLRKNDLEQSVYYLQRSVELRPNYPEAWNNLGMISAQKGDMALAIQNFQQSLSLRPGYATAMLNLGNVYRRQGDAQKALQLLSRAIEIQPDDPEINYSLGMFYAQQNQMPQATEYLRKALALRPNYPEALNNLGVLAVRQQDYVNAEEYFKSCILAAPSFDQAYLNLARLYAIRNEKEKAREILQRLLRVQPEHTAAKQTLEMLR